MRIIGVTIGCLLAASSGVAQVAPAPQITSEKARSLSAGELARRYLPEQASTIVDVRIEPDDPPFAMPPRRRDGPAMLGVVSFYSRPVPASDARYASAVCLTHQYTAVFYADGRPHYAQEPGTLYGAPVGRNGCDAAGPPSRFFYSPSVSIAATAIYAVRAIAIGARPKAASYRSTCDYGLSPGTSAPCREVNTASLTLDTLNSVEAGFCGPNDQLSETGDTCLVLSFHSSSLSKDRVVVRYVDTGGWITIRRMSYHLNEQYQV